MKGPQPRNIKERFEEKFIGEPMSGCWLWIAGLDGLGYGTFRIGSMSEGTRRQVKAHRFSYELYVGPIPKNLQIDHLCRVRCCVNPNHLEPVTQKENILRGETIAAFNLRKTHCPKGHLYQGRNLQYFGNSRRCGECNRLNSKITHKRKKGVVNVQ